MIQIEKMNHSDIEKFATENNFLQSMYGGIDGLMEMDLDSAQSRVRWWFSLGNTVGAFYGNNGF